MAVRLATPLTVAMAHQAPPGVYAELFLQCVAAAYQRRHAAGSRPPRSGRASPRRRWPHRLPRRAGRHPRHPAAATAPAAPAATAAPPPLRVVAAAGRVTADPATRSRPRDPPAGGFAPPS